MSIDKTKNIQILVTLPHDLAQKVEDYQFNNRIKNRNEAIRQLLAKAVEASK